MSDIQQSQSVQDRLKNAAIKLVLEKGFSGATLTPILREAGVSKGAMFHHFESRDSLMAAAYLQILESTMEQDRLVAYELRAGRIGLEHFIRSTCDRYRHESFAVTLELALAVRTRPQILAAAGGFAHWTEFRDRYWGEIFSLPGKTEDEARIHWDMLNYTLRGIGLRSMFGTDEKEVGTLANAIQKEFFSDAQVRPLDEMQDEPAET